MAAFSGICTLLSDFGERDGYVAAMKGVLLSRAAAVRLVDAGHGIAPQDVRAAAWVLRTYARWFPPGTIHLAVVDPGVGTERAGVVLEIDQQYFIGPDNGLFGWVLHEGGACRARRLPEVSEAAATFHGRDLFARIAGELLAGTLLLDDLEALSAMPMLPDWVRPRQHEGEGLVGEVVHVDRFGNVITNIPAKLIDEGGVTGWTLRMGGMLFDPRHRVRTYGEVAEGEWLLPQASHGMIELAVNLGSAADRGSLAVGDRVILQGS